MPRAAIQRHYWERQEYDRMIAVGIFHPEVRLELIDGEIINMTPQGSRHATTVQLAEDLLRVAFSTEFSIRIQMPLALNDSSEPEPDLAVVTGSPRDYRDAHPSSAVLIVEVADATLSFDRKQKKKLYARTSIQEYWIINLTDEQLEVYRDPQGDDYSFKTTLQPGQSIAPLAAPKNGFPVTGLLP